MFDLNNCLQCGSKAEHDTNKSTNAVFVKCTSCGIRTPEQSASLDFGAKDFVAAIWNKSQAESLKDWIKPSGAHDTYHKNDKVRHKGKNWVSLIDNNAGEPSASGWREI